MIGIVFHGAEVIDSGEAQQILKMLPLITHDFKAFLGGISGKTAVIDAGLTDLIDITRHKLPSALITELIENGYDFILLLNHAKTEKSGISLGGEIFRRVKSRIRASFSFVQIDYHGFIVPWQVEDEKLYTQIRESLELSEIAPPEPENRVVREGALVRRIVDGVEPGEKILVDGIVIGIAESEDLTIIEDGGKIIGLEGGRIIDENLLKFDRVNLASSMVKSVRYFREHLPEKIGTFKRGPVDGKVALLFTAERVFEIFEHVNGVVTIGDDTTAIVADIATRFGVPVLGITDGDIDGLIPQIGAGGKEDFEKIVPPGSLILRVRAESDDEIGYRIQEEIFGGEEMIELDFNMLCDRVLEIVNHDLVWMVRGSV